MILVIIFIGNRAMSIKLNVLNQSNVIASYVLENRQTLVIDAQDQVNYQLLEGSEELGPKSIVTKRVGNQLEIYLLEDNQALIVIKNYYLDEEHTNLIVGTKSNGKNYAYIPANNDIEQAVIALDDQVIATQVLGNDEIIGGFWSFNPWWLLSIVPLAGIVAAAGKSSGSSKNSISSNNEHSKFNTDETTIKTNIQQTLKDLADKVEAYNLAKTQASNPLSQQDADKLNGLANEIAALHEKVTNELDKLGNAETDKATKDQVQAVLNDPKNAIPKNIVLPSKSPIRVQSNLTGKKDDLGNISISPEKDLAIGSKIKIEYINYNKQPSLLTMLLTDKGWVAEEKIATPSWVSLSKESGEVILKRNILLGGTDIKATLIDQNNVIYESILGRVAHYITHNPKYPDSTLGQSRLIDVTIHSESNSQNNYDAKDILIFSEGLLDINLNTNEGDDEIIIEHRGISRETIRNGYDNTYISIANRSLSHNTNIDMGNGNDTLISKTVLSHSNINLGEGDNIAKIHNIQGSSTSQGIKATLIAGEGNDIVDFNRDYLRYSNTGNGKYISEYNAQGVIGASTINTSLIRSGSTIIDLGNGNNTITTTNSPLGYEFRAIIRTGNGQDLIDLRNSAISAYDDLTAIQSGSGNDVVKLGGTGNIEDFSKFYLALNQNAHKDDPYKTILKDSNGNKGSGKGRTDASLRNFEKIRIELGEGDDELYLEPTAKDIKTPFDTTLWGTFERGILDGGEGLDSLIVNVDIPQLKASGKIDNLGNDGDNFVLNLAQDRPNTVSLENYRNLSLVPIPKQTYTNFTPEEAYSNMKKGVFIQNFEEIDFSQSSAQQSLRHITAESLKRNQGDLDNGKTGLLLKGGSEDSVYLTYIEQQYLQFDINTHGHLTTAQFKALQGSGTTVVHQLEKQDDTFTQGEIIYDHYSISDNSGTYHLYVQQGVQIIG